MSDTHDDDRDDHDEQERARRWLADFRRRRSGQPTAAEEKATADEGAKWEARGDYASNPLGLDLDFMRKPNRFTPKPPKPFSGRAVHTNDGRADQARLEQFQNEMSGAPKGWRDWLK